MRVWHAHTGKLRGMTFSPDGRRLATTAGESRFVWLWDAATGQLAHKLAGHRYAAKAVAFTPDGRHLASTQDANELNVWEVESGHLVGHLHCPGGRTEALAIAPSGSPWVIADFDGYRVWDDPLPALRAETPRPAHRVRRRHAHIPRIGFSPSGRYFAATDGTLDLMERGPDRIVRQFVDRTYANASGFAFTPDESRIAITFGHRVGVWSLDDPDRPLVMIVAHEGMVRAVGFTPSGRSLLTAGMDGLVRLWDPTTGAEQRSFNWDIGQVQAAAISPDGLLCAAGSSAGHIVAWDVDE